MCRNLPISGRGLPAEYPATTPSFFLEQQMIGIEPVPLNKIVPAKKHVLHNNPLKPVAPSMVAQSMGRSGGLVIENFNDMTKSREMGFTCLSKLGAVKLIPDAFDMFRFRPRVLP